jgi:hypothetical protein
MLHPNLERRKHGAGRFSICLTRAHSDASTTREKVSTEWISGFTIHEVEDEARLLVGDPRDTITSAMIWDDRWSHFCLTVTSGTAAAVEAAA